MSNSVTVERPALGHAGTWTAAWTAGRQHLPQPLEGRWRKKKVSICLSRCLPPAEVRLHIGRICAVNTDVSERERTELPAERTGGCRAREGREAATCAAESWLCSSNTHMTAGKDWDGGG